MIAMERKAKFKIVYTDEALEFITNQPEKVREKIADNIDKSRYFTDNNIFKKLDGTDIWEFRTLYNKLAYRLFAFWDTEEQSLVIATHGIIKKTQRTPRKEIAKAERIRDEYFKNK